MSNVLKIVTITATFVGINIIAARLQNGLSSYKLERDAEKDLAKCTGIDNLKVTITPGWLKSRWTVVVTDANGNVVHTDSFSMKREGLVQRWTTYDVWLTLVHDAIKGEQV